MVKVTKEDRESGTHYRIQAVKRTVATNPDGTLSVSEKVFSETRARDIASLRRAVTSEKKKRRAVEVEYVNFTLSN